MNTKHNLIEDVENKIQSFTKFFSTNSVKNEFEVLCGTWFEIVHELDELENKLSQKLDSKSFLDNQIETLKVQLATQNNTVVAIEDVDTEVKLRSTMELLENLQREDCVLEGNLNKVIAESKNILRNVDTITDMKKIQQETQSLQTAYRKSHNTVQSKIKKYGNVARNLDEFLSQYQEHDLFLETTLQMLNDIVLTLDQDVLDYGKSQVTEYESAIMEHSLQRDALISLARTGPFLEMYFI